MKTLFIWLLFVPFTLWSCNKPGNETIPEEKPVESLLPDHLKGTVQMVWNDEFDGTAVNLTKRNFRAEGTVRNYGTVSRQTISLDWNGQKMSISFTSTGRRPGEALLPYLNEMSL